MPALFTNQIHAVQNKTCLAIYSIYSILHSICDCICNYSKVLWNE